MSSDSKTLSLATIGTEQWKLFKKFVEWTVANGDDEVAHRILYDSKESKSWLFEYFLSKGKTKGPSKENQKECWILSPRGERIIARLRDISAEVLAPLINTNDELISTISSFGNDHNQAIKFMRNVYEMTKWRIMQDISAFHIYRLQETELHGMQRDMFAAFGIDDVFHEVGKFFTFNFFIHIGRYLGYHTVPKRTSFAFAFSTYVLRCVCKLVNNNYEDPSKFPKVQVDSKLGLISYGENEFETDDGTEFIIDEEDNSILTDDTLGQTTTGSSIDSGWNSNSSEARVLRLFALKHWYEYCIVNHHYFNKHGLMGEAMDKALEEYNLHCAEMKVAPIDTPIMKTAAKRCAEANWLDKLTSTAKDGISQEIISNLAQTSSLEPPRPEGDNPIQDWLPSTGHHHDQQDRRSRWVAFYSWHLMKLKTSSSVNLSRKRKLSDVSADENSSREVSAANLVRQARFSDESAQPHVLIAKLPAVSLSAAPSVQQSSTATQRLTSLLTKENLLQILEEVATKKP